MPGDSLVKRSAPFGLTAPAPRDLLQGGAAVACVAHNHDVVGSNPTPATKLGRTMEREFDQEWIKFEIDRAERLAEVCADTGFGQAADHYRATAKALNKQLAIKIAREQQPG